MLFFLLEESVKLNYPPILIIQNQAEYMPEMITQYI